MFRLHEFVPIFRILYSDLKSDIIINGKIVNGYKIKRGVKEGYALSCILFIIHMEPLLRNIEENRLIVPIHAAGIGDLPKVVAYADGLNGIIRNNPIAIKELFKESELLARASGLELNADKTEIMLCDANTL